MEQKQLRNKLQWKCFRSSEGGYKCDLFCKRGWSGGAMVLGKLPVPGGVLLIWNRVGQGPTALAVGAGWGCLDIFSLIYHFSFLSPSLWETARYRLKYCLKGPLSPNQPTNQLFCKLICKFGNHIYYNNQ